MKVRLVMTFSWMVIALASASDGVTEKRRVPRVVVRPGPSLPQPSHSPPQISTRIIGGVNAQSGSVAVLNRPGPTSVGVRTPPIIRAGSEVPTRRCLIYNEFRLCVKYV